MDERSATFEHFGKLTKTDNGERPNTNGEYGGDMFKSRLGESNETRQDGAIVEKEKNKEQRSHTSKCDSHYRKGDTLSDDCGVQTIRLQYTSSRNLSLGDHESSKEKQNGSKTNAFSSDAHQSSFNNRSSGDDYPLAKQSREGSEIKSIHTNLWDASNCTERNLELKFAHSLADTMSRRSLARVACWSNRNLSEAERELSMQAGVPIYQLSRDELFRTFPKLVAVADNKLEVIGRPCEFQKSLPAYLQASFSTRGEPQSLYEYNYESEEYKFVSYKTFCSFPEAFMCVERRKLVTQSSVSIDNVLIQVEASTVSQTDCLIRQGKWRRHTNVPLPNTPGVDVIGKVCRIDKSSSQRYKLVAGDRVMSLVTWGGNSRYVQIDPTKAVKVPEKIDPVSTVCLAETYLSAYQILFHGIKGTRRQKKGSLRGRTYMFFGFVDHNVASAIAEIANYAGVKAVYARIVPFDQACNDFTTGMKGTFDRIVLFDQDVSKLQFDMLNKQGDTIIICGVELMSKALGPEGPQANLLCSKSNSQLHGKTYRYNVFNEWDERNEQCKADLSFLINLLIKGIISPWVRHRIPLHHMSKVHEMLETKECSGFLVCEP